MPSYMLLFKGSEDTTKSPAEMQAIVEKYMAWIRDLRAKNVYEAGDELAPTGRVLSKKNGSFVDGPYVETKESVGGFFTVTAKNYDEAVAHAKGCPSLDTGGYVEIREIIDHSQS